MKSNSYLNKETQQKYDDIMAFLQKENTYKECDDLIVSMLVSQWDKALWAEKEIKKQKTLVFETQTGYKQQIPEVSILNNAQKTMLSLIKELGLSPASRARMKEIIFSDDDDPEMESLICK